MKNERENPHEQPRHEPDQLRRRLTKAGLTAPVVLGTLASRPVLGQALHHCTPSGHISGFASPNPNAASCNVGNSVEYYAADLSRWPTEFLAKDNNNNKDPHLFRDSPAGVGVLFLDAYERVITEIKNNQTKITSEPATVWDVLKGVALDKDGNPVGELAVVGGSANVDLELGQEAVAACMNALSVPGFPISATMVVNMFNGVFKNKTDNVTDKNSWDKEHLKDYFQTLQ